MCSDDSDEELRELMRRNYNEVDREYLRGQMEHAIECMPEDERKAWKSEQPLAKAKGFLAQIILEWMKSSKKMLDPILMLWYSLYI